MASLKKLGIVVPIFCNQSSLNLLFSKLETLNENLKNVNIECYYAFVDDGSTDNSWNTLININTSIKAIFIKHTKNFGTVRAIKSGLNYLDCDAYTCIAADLQDPPELIENMVDNWLNENYKVVLCSRKIKNDSFLNDLFSKLYCLIMNKLLNNSYPNGGFDIALIDNQFINYFKSIPKYMYFQPLLIGLGIKYKTIEYERPVRVHGISQNTLRKKLRDFSDSFLSISNLPLRFVTIFAILISLVSLTYSIVLIINNLIVGNAVPGYTTIIALISFLCGSIIFLLGIIGEYIWRIYDCKYGLPKPVVEFDIKNF